MPGAERCGAGRREAERHWGNIPEAERCGVGHRGAELHGTGRHWGNMPGAERCGAGRHGAGRHGGNFLGAGGQWNRRFWGKK